MSRPAQQSHELTDTQSRIVAEIRALRAYTDESGFHTTRSQKEILARLNANDLAAVLLSLEAAVHDEVPIGDLAGVKIREINAKPKNLVSGIKSRRRKLKIELLALWEELQAKIERHPVIGWAVVPGESPATIPITATLVNDPISERATFIPAECCTYQVILSWVFGFQRLGVEFANDPKDWQDEAVARMLAHLRGLPRDQEFLGATHPMQVGEVLAKLGNVCELVR